MKFHVYNQYSVVIVFVCLIRAHPNWLLLLWCPSHLLCLCMFLCVMLMSVVCCCVGPFYLLFIKSEAKK